MNKYVIYTSITGNYDNLPQYGATDQNFDYICFSNDYPDGSIQGIWTIKNIPYQSHNNILLSRFAKLLPHRVLREYDSSLWIDSNLIIKDSKFYSYIRSRIKEGGLWYGIKHHKRDCIYDEANACMNIGYSGFFETRKQVRKLKKSGYPKHYGLFENNIILRRHNNKIIESIDEEWWEMLQSYTKRDQLSLFYLFWKNNIRPNYLMSENMTSRNVDMLEFLGHNKKSLRKRIKRKITCISNSIFNLIFQE